MSSEYEGEVNFNWNFWLIFLALIQFYINHMWGNKDVCQNSSYIFQKNI